MAAETRALGVMDRPLTHKRALSWGDTGSGEFMAGNTNQGGSSMHAGRQRVTTAAKLPQRSETEDDWVGAKAGNERLVSANLKL